MQWSSAFTLVCSLSPDGGGGLEMGEMLLPRWHVCPVDVRF